MLLFRFFVVKQSSDMWIFSLKSVHLNRKYGSPVMVENGGGNQNTADVRTSVHVETCGMRKNKGSMKDMCSVTSF